MEVLPGQAVVEKLSQGQNPEASVAPPGCVSVIPMGGVGEVGKNLTLIETDDDLIAIDCGLRFARGQEHPGIDFLLPDLTYVRQQKKKLRGLVITHGHEDHIGALPWWCREFDTPIWASRFAMGLIRAKLDERGLLGNNELRQYGPGDKFSLGGLEIEPFTVSHSIPDGFGLRVRTPVGNIVHSGDFKMDTASPAGQETDQETLRRFGDEGVLALLSDSTNAHREGRTAGELEVGPALEKVFRDTKGKVIATCFASNVQRFQQVLNAAAGSDRQVACLGRSMQQNMRLAADLGILDVPERVWIDIEDLARKPPEKSVVLSTGSQGEPNSGLTRIASGSHKHARIEAGDRLVYSARAIPGNERWVSDLFNRFYRAGAEVVTERDARVHVSGHGSREDLELMLQLTRPRFLIPGHGEERHQEAHRVLAHGQGMENGAVFALRNGERWVTNGKKAWTHGAVPAGEFLADGDVAGDDWDETLRQRRALREDGVAVCVLAIRKLDGKIVQGPDIQLRGVAPGEESGIIERELGNRVRQAIGEADPDPEDLAAWEETVLRAGKRYFKKQYANRPLVVPVIMLI